MKALIKKAFSICVLAVFFTAAGLAGFYLFSRPGIKNVSLSSPQVTAPVETKIFDTAVASDGMLFLPNQIYYTIINTAWNNHRFIDGKNCGIVGNKINLPSESPDVYFYAITTVKSCGWHEENAPIWVLRATMKNEEFTETKIIMETYGATLATNKTSHMGMPDIISSPDMIYSEQRWKKSRWRYNGTRYFMVDGEKPPF